VNMLICGGAGALYSVHAKAKSNGVSTEICPPLNGGVQIRRDLHFSPILGGTILVYGVEETVAKGLNPAGVRVERICVCIID
jgi:hypothetical protein